MALCLPLHAEHPLLQMLYIYVFLTLTLLLLQMPYIYFLLDQSTTEAIKETATRIQDGSTFLSQLDERAGLGCVPFHVKLLMSLHVYQDDAVFQVLEMISKRTGVLHGRFVKWEVTQKVCAALSRSSIGRQWPARSTPSFRVAARAP